MQHNETPTRTDLDWDLISRTSKANAEPISANTERALDLEVPGAQHRISLLIGAWKKYNGSQFVAVPSDVKAGDAYRNLWVMGERTGQIRMYTETLGALYLEDKMNRGRFEEVDGAVEKVIGKPVQVEG